MSEHRQCSRPPQRNLLLESTLVHLATGSASLQYAGRSTRRTYVEFAGVEVVASLVAHVGCDAPAGGIVNAAVDCRRLTLIDALKETWNSSERASLSDPERGHLLCPDLQSAQCRRLNIPPALPPPTHLAAEEAELGHTQKSEHVAVCYSRPCPLLLWCSGTKFGVVTYSSVLEERVSKLEKIDFFVFQARREEVVE